MASEYVVWGAKGSGSVPVEAALTLIGAPYELRDLANWYDVQTDAEAGRLNPQRQLPALVLASGEVITESAAILLYLAEAHPQARLAPPADAPERAQFLRWMIYVPAQIYSMCWVRDVPSRLAAGPAAEAVIKARTRERVADCWRMMDAQVEPSPWIAGARMSVLDIYVTVISRWIIGRRRFYEIAPKMAEVVRRVDAEPRLAALWAERMPFEEGWEG